eukprot:144886-Chlamydomonas_euryale.AAC.2
MAFPCLSHGLPMACPWLFYGFPMPFPWLAPQSPATPRPPLPQPATPIARTEPATLHAPASSHHPPHKPAPLLHPPAHSPPNPTHPINPPNDLTLPDHPPSTNYSSPLVCPQSGSSGGAGESYMLDDRFIDEVIAEDAHEHDHAGYGTAAAGYAAAGDSGSGGADAASGRSGPRSVDMGQTLSPPPPS